MTRVVSVRRRLVVRLLAGMLVISCATTGFAYWYLREEIVEQYDLALLAKARALAGVVGLDRSGEVVYPLRPESMPEFHSQPRDTDYFQIWRADGTALARSPSLATADLPHGEPARGTDPHGFMDVSLPGGRIGRAAWLTFRIPRDDDYGSGSRGRASSLPAASRPDADLLIVVATSGEEFDETMAHMTLTLVAAAVMTSVGTVMLVLGAVRQGLRPVREVAEAAGRIDAGRLNYRFDTAALPAELQPIAERLNALLERLDEAFRRERRFTANVAHELRTPIAELRASAEVALKWPDDADLAAKGLRDALAVSRRMEAVVTSLLALVRCEAGQNQVAAEKLALADVVSGAWRAVSDAATRRGLTTCFDIPPETRVFTDRTLVHSLLGNLFSNAVSYAPVGGLVGCKCVTETEGVTLVVMNTNTDLVPDDLAHIAEPFWRKDPARSDSAHAGLGLSLVAAYAAALGASVKFSIEGDNFFVRTVLPCPSSTESGIENRQE